MSARPTTLEGRVAQLIRLACSNHEGEAIAAGHAIVRTLKAAGANDIHALADRIEKTNGSSPVRDGDAKALRRWLPRRRASDRK